MTAIKHQILIFVFFVSGVGSVTACEVVWQSHYKYFRKARAVFIGRVIEIRPNDSSISDEQKYFPNKIKFAVEKSWKGGKDEIVTVSDSGTSMCTPDILRIGEKYLVYAFGKNLFVPTYVGNRSRRLGNVNNDVTKKEFTELDSFWFRFKSKLWFF